MIKQWSVVLCIGAGLINLAGAPASAQDAKPAAVQESKAPAGDVENGKKLYRATGCYECHGTVAQGSPRTGPMLLTARPFDGFLRQLRRPSAEMPPYVAKVLSDQQAADIYAFIQTLPKPVDYKTIKILQ
jgi:ubiquinol-cytochrome c reductase cytochrome c subunit